MKSFAHLFEILESSNKSNVKLRALKAFFDAEKDEEKLWLLALFSGKKPSRPVKTSLLREWCAEMSGLPLWLLEESYHIAGDLAETLSLLAGPVTGHSDKALNDWAIEVSKLKAESEEYKKKYIMEAWSTLNTTERFLFNKIITGGFRIGVAKNTIIKAVAQSTGQDEAAITHRITGNWSPLENSWYELIEKPDHKDLLSKPYPFYLAYPLEQEPDELGRPEEWSAEWKWDGIRAQLIVRKGQCFLWSRGEELISKSFPEFSDIDFHGQDQFVLDAELLIKKDGVLMDFNTLQKRIGRKKPSKKIIESLPAVLICYDLLEYKGEDIRHKSLMERRQKLETLLHDIHDIRLSLSPQIQFGTWKELAIHRTDSRAMKAEGLMLKRINSDYKTGRKRGDWWKWKVDPLTVDAVVIYAQRGHGRRSNLYTDFTLAVRDGDSLIPFTKAYSGLTDKEFNEVTSFVRKNTIERYGPVSSIKPEIVFEIAFEGIAASPRHKSGIALRFPRISRWRKDKSANDINTLTDLKALLQSRSEE
jgi:DNA ligase 1